VKWVIFYLGCVVFAVWLVKGAPMPPVRLPWPLNTSEGASAVLWAGISLNLFVAFRRWRRGDPVSGWIWSLVTVVVIVAARLL
jgi:hypothetical protein